MKDGNVRKNPAERQAVIDHSVRCFSLSKKSMTGETMAALFLKHLDSIVEACEESGPFFYTIQQRKLERRL